MRRTEFKATIAVAAILAVVFAWQWGAPRNLLAATVRAMAEAKGFRCDLVRVRPGNPGAEDATVVGRVYWSASGDERVETLQDDEVRSIGIHRPGRGELTLHPASRQYESRPARLADGFSFGLFGQLNEYKGKAEATLAAKEILGTQAKGFVIPWSSVRDDHPGAKIHLWVDDAGLPVRAELHGFVPNRADVMRLENFRWGDQDPKLFDMTVPAGYAKVTKQTFQVDEITGYVTYGLSVFAKYNDGKYPAVRNVYGDQQGEALRTLMKMGAEATGWIKPDKDLKWDDPKQGEFAHGTYGLSWINALQRDYPECVYRGKSVTAKDADKVLLRWKRDDGQYRVIFGDLKTADVSADRLKEIEAK